VTVVPARWQRLLLAIREVCPSAVLAGGALRDLLLDRPIKDLDIFINARAMQLADEAIAALRLAGFTVEFDPCDLTAYPEDQNLEVVAVATLSTPEDLAPFAGLRVLPVQLIFTNWDTSRITDRFDYGICQVAYDGETITFGDHFNSDRIEEVFRLRRDRPTPVSMRGSVHRYARLVNKYPGWTWWPYDVPAICDFPF
jgi:tRNA nucleotidyltransferase/poly(A) polymerase